MNVKKVKHGDIHFKNKLVLRGIFFQAFLLVHLVLWTLAIHCLKLVTHNAPRNPQVLKPLDGREEADT